MPASIVSAYSPSKRQKAVHEAGSSPSLAKQPQSLPRVRVFEAVSVRLAVQSVRLAEHVLVTAAVIVAVVVAVIVAVPETAWATVLERLDLLTWPICRTKAYMGSGSVPMCNATEMQASMCLLSLQL